jgi:hypothetical protein
MHTFKLLLLSTMLGCSVSAWTKVCVLNFERSESPITKAVLKTFRDAPQVDVKVMAMPLDLLGCVKSRAEEILIIGHALETPASMANKTPVNLAYFMELTMEEKTAHLQSSLEKIDGELATLTPDQKERIKKLQKSRRDYLAVNLTQTLYQINPILPRAFSLARKELDLQARSRLGVSLKKIRLMACVPDQVLAQYRELTEMIQDHGLELDVAPKNKFLSFFEKKTVTSPDPVWLRKSIY